MELANIANICLHFFPFFFAYYAFMFFMCFCNDKKVSKNKMRERVSEKATTSSRILESKVLTSESPKTTKNIHTKSSLAVEPKTEVERTVVNIHTMSSLAVEPKSEVERTVVQDNVNTERRELVDECLKELVRRDKNISFELVGAKQLVKDLQANQNDAENSENLQAALELTVGELKTKLIGSKDVPQEQIHLLIQLTVKNKEYKSHLFTDDLISFETEFRKLMEGLLMEYNNEKQAANLDCSCLSYENLKCLLRLQLKFQGGGGRKNKSTYSSQNVPNVFESYTTSTIDEGIHSAIAFSRSTTKIKVGYKILKADRSGKSDPFYQKFIGQPQVCKEDAALNGEPPVCKEDVLYVDRNCSLVDLIEMLIEVNNGDRTGIMPRCNPTFKFENFKVRDLNWELPLNEGEKDLVVHWHHDNTSKIANYFDTYQNTSLAHLLNNRVEKIIKLTIYRCADSNMKRNCTVNILHGLLFDNCCPPNQKHNDRKVIPTGPPRIEAIRDSLWIPVEFFQPIMNFYKLCNQQKKKGIIKMDESEMEAAWERVDENGEPSSSLDLPCYYRIGSDLTLSDHTHSGLYHHLWYNKVLLGGTLSNMEDIIKRVRQILFSPGLLELGENHLFISNILYRNDKILQDFIEYVNPFSMYQTMPFYGDFSRFVTWILKENERHRSQQRPVWSIVYYHHLNSLPRSFKEEQDSPVKNDEENDEEDINEPSFGGGRSILGVVEGESAEEESVEEDVNEPPLGGGSNMGHLIESEEQIYPTPKDIVDEQALWPFWVYGGNDKKSNEEDRGRTVLDGLNLEIEEEDEPPSDGGSNMGHLIESEKQIYPNPEDIVEQDLGGSVFTEPFTLVKDPSQDTVGGMPLEAALFQLEFQSQQPQSQQFKPRDNGNDSVSTLGTFPSGVSDYNIDNTSYTTNSTGISDSPLQLCGCSLPGSRKRKGEKGRRRESKRTSQNKPIVRNRRDSNASVSSSTSVSTFTLPQILQMKDLFIDESPPRERLSEVLGWEYLQDVPVHDETISETGFDAFNSLASLIPSGTYENFEEIDRSFLANERDDDDDDASFPKDERDFDWTEKRK